MPDEGCRFHIVDVFAEEKYAGNQLAVVETRGRLSGAEMQRVAAEFNFPETTFISGKTSRASAFNVRIFTPRREVPFAGHPILGTAYIIKHKLAKPGSDRIVLNLKAGKIPVSFDRKRDLLWMKQMPAAFGKKHKAGAMSEILGLNPNEIDPRYPIQEVSTGLPFVIVPLASLAAVRKARVDVNSYEAHFNSESALPIFVFSRETYHKTHHINCRMFAHIFGIPEDPATGSANGCLAGYVSKYAYFQKEDVDIQVERGYEINRRSLLRAKVESGKAGMDIYVGGKVIEVAEGMLK